MAEAEEIATRKRAADDEEEYDSDAVKRPRVESDANEAEQQPSNLPADFFSTPRPPQTEDDAEDEKPADPPPVTATKAVDPALDADWEVFQREVLNAPDLNEMFERATIAVEPQLVPVTHEGIPQQEDIQPDATSEERAAEAKRKQKAQEEKELIMDRLLDEERAQEEADMRVSVMKGRLDALKKKRAAKGKPTPS